MQRPLLVLFALASCAPLGCRAASPAPLPPTSAQTVREEQPDPALAQQALETFLGAAEAGDFALAYLWLAAPLRARYTPALLERDFGAEPQAEERLARARAALGRPPELEGDEARFPIGEGRAVRLLREGPGYRVAALE